MKTANICIKILSSLICILIIASACGCSPNKPSKETSSEPAQSSPSEASKEYTRSVKRKVIIDTDTGADDASAIILASKCDNIDILGVTVLAGNVDLRQSADNALAALEIAGCEAPVYLGSESNCSGEEINAFSVFGTDGMGDADLIHPKGKPQDKDAVDFIIETVKNNPGEIEIIAIGPATNIAKAIEKDPETMKKVKMIWSMGSQGMGPGNATPVAEFNVFNDAVAYNTMLNSDIDITIIGLDMCLGDAQWTDENFEKLEASGDIGKFVSSSFGKIREFYASNGSAGFVANCDCLAMTSVIFDNFIKDTVSCHGSCITDDCEAYGEVIFYKKDFTYDIAKNLFSYNVTLVSDVAEEDYFNLFLKTIS